MRGNRASVNVPTERLAPVADTSWPWLSYRDALAFCDDILSRPPCGRFVVRVEPVGDLVIRFVLPLGLCPTTNATRHAPRWVADRRMARTRNLMEAQSLAARWHRSKGPLPGRPQVRCIRFSNRRPDPLANWAKGPVDLLTSKHDGLNLIQDDSALYCQPSEQWEPSGKRGVGCCLIEVWSNVLPYIHPETGAREAANPEEQHHG